MKGFYKGLMLKLAVLLVLPFIFMGCCGSDKGVNVYITNDTNMNFHIKFPGTAGEGVRVRFGQTILLRIFCQEGESHTYDLCREYGCLAKLTITAKKIPEDAGYVDNTVLIAEDFPNDISIFVQGDLINATLEPIDQNP